MFGIRVQRLGAPGDPYLTRVHLTPWRWWPFRERAYLHVFHRPDGDPWAHDHPFDFGSLVLWGGYTEMAWTGETLGRFNYRLNRHQIEPYLVPTHRGWLSWRRVPAEHVHTITALDRTPTVTLVLRGPKRRDWSFHVPGDTTPEAVLWTDYLGIPPQPPAYA